MLSVSVPLPAVVSDWLPVSLTVPAIVTAPPAAVVTVRSSASLTPTLAPSAFVVAVVLTIAAPPPALSSVRVPVPVTPPAPAKVALPMAKLPAFRFGVLVAAMVARSFAAVGTPADQLPAVAQNWLVPPNENVELIGAAIAAPDPRAAIRTRASAELPISPRLRMDLSEGACDPRWVSTKVRAPSIFAIASAPQSHNHIRAPRKIAPDLTAV